MGNVLLTDAIGRIIYTGADADAFQLLETADTFGELVSLSNLHLTSHEWNQIVQTLGSFLGMLPINGKVPLYPEKVLETAEWGGIQ